MVVSSEAAGDANVGQAEPDAKLRRRLQNREAQRNSRLRKAAQRKGEAASFRNTTVHCYCCCQHRESVNRFCHDDLLQRGGPGTEPALLANTLGLYYCSSLPVSSETSQSTMYTRPPMELTQLPESHNHGGSVSDSHSDDLQRSDDAADPIPNTLIDPGLNPLDSENSLDLELYFHSDVAGTGKPPSSGASVAENNETQSASVTYSAMQALTPTAAIRRKTPMHVCAAAGNHKIVDILIRGGSNTNSVDEAGRTPLHYAVEGGHIDVIKALLNGKADTGVVDMLGISPMHLAVATSQDAIVVLLLELGASPDV